MRMDPELEDVWSVTCFVVGKTVIWDEASVGLVQVFLEAG
jgi:hypothetical protein